MAHKEPNPIGNLLFLYTEKPKDRAWGTTAIRKWRGISGGKKEEENGNEETPNSEYKLCSILWGTLQSCILGQLVGKA